MLQHVYVATNDMRIAVAVEKFGGNCIMTSEEHKSGTDRCAEAIIIVEKQTGIQFDIVLNIQGDEPFIHPEQIREICSCFDHPQAQIATLVKRITDQNDIFNPNKPKVVISSQNEALYFSRSPIPYVRGHPGETWLNTNTFFKHLGMYAYKRAVLLQITKLQVSSLEKAESLEQLRWLENGYRIFVEETFTESPSVDTPGDLELILKSGLL